MDKQRNYNQPARKLIGYEVDVVDGKLCETRVYEPYSEPAPVEQASTKEALPAKQPVKTERAATQPRNFRGKSLASASIFFASVAGVMYAGDAISTYAQEQKIISPLDAYEDFTELPSLIGPVIDKIQTIAKVISN
ncbi:MAG TPA: hypothetical protein VGO98_00020 [Candidatus Saccharimonadales bacterium]|nr:hypothetical protein [Candidatus Saccharimonadales bacterium]